MCATTEKTPLDTCPIGLIRGKIEKGNLKKVREFSYIQFYPKRFYLDSPGGDVDEALEIGRFFKQFLTTTIAPSPNPATGNYELMGRRAVCLSACAFAWFGGIQRMGDVGLHRPYFTDEEYKRMPPDQASVVYNAMLDRVKAYMNEMEVPRSITEKMLSTSSGNVFMVSWLRDSLYTPPSVSEWIGANCGKVEYKWQPYQTDITPEQDRKMQCESKLLTGHHFKVVENFIRILNGEARKKGIKMRWEFKDEPTTASSPWYCPPFIPGCKS
jgi:hypothetical protein